MKRRPKLLTYFFFVVSIYPLLIFIIIMTVLGAYLFSDFMPRLSNIVSEPTATPRTWRLATLPTAPSVSVSESVQISPQDNVASTEIQSQTFSATGITTSDSVTAATVVNNNVPSQANAPESVDTSTTSVSPSSNAASSSDPVVTDSEQPSISALPLPSPTLALDFSAFSGTRTPRQTPTPKSGIRGLVADLLGALNESDSTSTPRPLRILPTLTPTPTSTDTPIPTATPTGTPTPTNTPIPTNTPLPTDTPLPTNTPLPTSAPTTRPLPPPTATPLPTNTPTPEYDFLLNEFYNSPTTNHFLVMYVAVVDGNNVPIGDMKVVGTRLDHNLTYESPLTTWYYEGYNAPGEQIKSGNTKFEPPGGIENTSWLIHLEDAHGNRMSDDVPFDVREDDRQWYFVRFRRKF